MDFMSDSLHNKVRFRTFNVIDDFNREVLGIDIDLTMVDSGSIHSLKEEGKIDGEFIDVVTRNLSLVDKELSFVFGLGDGIVVSKANDEMKDFMETNLMPRQSNGRSS